MIPSLRLGSVRKLHSSYRFFACLCDVGGVLFIHMNPVRLDRFAAVFDKDRFRWATRQPPRPSFSSH